MSQDHYLISETEFDTLRAFSESFHFMLVEFIEKRRLRSYGEEEGESPECENFKSIYEELDLLNQQKFDF